jgi:hypothetical protein
MGSEEVQFQFSDGSRSIADRGSGRRWRGFVRRDADAALIFAAPDVDSAIARQRAPEHQAGGARICAASTCCAVRTAPGKTSVLEAVYLLGLGALVSLCRGWIR